MVIICTSLLYTMFIYCIAIFFTKQSLNIILQHSKDLKTIAATCVMLLTFLFIPLDALPPIIDVEYGSILILLLIAYANFIQEKKERSYLFVAFLTITFALFSLLVYFCGIPGHLFCIESYSSPLIWQVLSLPAKVIYILLGILFVALLFRQFLSQKIKEKEAPPLLILKNLLYIAIFSAIFLPSVSLTTAPSFTSNLVIFWIGWAKILTVYGVLLCLHLLSSKNYSKLKKRCYSL